MGFLLYDSSNKVYEWKPCISNVTGHVLRTLNQFCSKILLLHTPCLATYDTARINLSIPLKDTLAQDILCQCPINLLAPALEGQMKKNITLNENLITQLARNHSNYSYWATLSQVIDVILTVVVGHKLSLLWLYCKSPSFSLAKGRLSIWPTANQENYPGN